MRRFILLIASVLCFWMEITYGQSYRPGHYWTGSMRYNPSLLPFYGYKLQVGIDQRWQWMRLGTGYVSSMLQAAGRIYQTQQGQLHGGINLVYDRAGAFTVMDGQLALAYGHLLTRRLEMVGTLTGAVLREYIDPAPLAWSDQYIDGAHRPEMPTQDQIVRSHRWVPRIGAGAGVNMYTPRNLALSVGMFVDNLNAPNTSHLANSQVARKYKYVGHILLHLYWGVKSYAGFGMYTWNEGTAKEQAYGGFIRYKEFTVSQVSLFGAVWYRINRSMMIAIGVGNNNWDLYYSYDVAFGNFAADFAQVPVHEISLVYSKLYNNRRRYRPKY